MIDIRLSKMGLRNFKGIKNFSLVINGQNANIFADNGLGKTTCMDGFLWMLFGKDSANRADFSVKPQDENGNDIHFLETDVTLELLVNRRPKTLRKMLKEKWTRKRGAPTDEFTGHETSYWIDEVPVKAKEFQAEINKIIDENAFKLLTNPFYFCTQLKWEERRKILMEICGDVTDAEVIASDASLKDLVNILNGKSINDQRKIIAERIKMLNKQIEDIPVKINELSRTLLGEEVNYSVVEERLLEQKAMLKKIEQSMMDANQLALEYQKKQQKSFGIRQAMDDRKRELDENAMAGLKRATDEKVKLEGEKYRLTSEKAALNNQMKAKLGEAELLGEKNSELRKQWGLESEKPFVEPNEENFVCPTCEQLLPVERRQEKIAQMRANFENNKAKVLAQINTEGKANAERIKSLGSEIEEIQSKLDAFDAKLTEISEVLIDIDKEVEDERQRTFGANYDADARYSGLNTQLQDIKAELSKPVEDTSSDLLQQKNTVTEQIESLNKVLNNREVEKRTKARIDELKNEERTLASQLSEFEKQRYLIEQFIKAKVNLLESTINNRFKLVKWKLFDVQINGGISECCEAMVDGVTWPNVNHAKKVNAGLDIINVLSDHYECTAPIFIDFRESVSRIIETKSQVINLIKSEPDKTLRVEVA